MLLSALPSEWSTGWVQRLVARGGFEVNIEWANGSFQQANVYSRLGRDMNITVFNLPTGKNTFTIKELGLTSHNGYIATTSTQGKNYSIVVS